MSRENLVHMANQIALNLAGYSRDEAIAGVADHLEKFWPPRMRAQIIDYAAQGGAGLHELALEAVKRLKPVEEPARTGS